MNHHPPDRLVDLLKKYRTMVFGCGKSVLVETGTYVGDGVVAALAAGYEEIHTFEIDERRAERARVRFAGEPVTVHPVSSTAREFAELVAALDFSAVFWLDAHFMGAVKNPTPETYPLKHEISVVANSGLAHVILCDDVRLFQRYGTSVVEIMQTLQATIAGYSFCLESCRSSIPQDVLACFPPEPIRCPGEKVLDCPLPNAGCGGRLSGTNDLPEESATVKQTDPNGRQLGGQVGGSGNGLCQACSSPL